MTTLPAVLDDDKLALLRRTIAAGTSPDEFELFAAQCRRTGLDPFSRQLYCFKSGGKLTIGVSIDGLRLIADRTGRYVPGPEPSLTYDDKGKLISATAYVRKLVAGEWHTVAATAYLEEFQQNSPPWQRMKRHMLAKCFSPDTEVLTDKGFERFPDVRGRVLQVTQHGMEPTDARPFCQPYDGDMVALDSDDLNFCVTPNHDMLTTAGKIEAGELYEAARSRPRHWVPRCVHSSAPYTVPMTNQQLRLAAAYLADGQEGLGDSFRVEVSRPDKIADLDALGLWHTTRIRATAGTVAHTAVRTIVCRADKKCFLYGYSWVAPLCDRGKLVNTDVLWRLTREQARVFVDAWISFDGHTSKASGVRRVFTSRLDHLAALEVACVVAGYSVSFRHSRTSDISRKPNFFLTISDRSEIPVLRWGRPYHRTPHKSKGHTGLELTPNLTGDVWCVTVPSGLIVVRRNGFSMVCGNCAEAMALRRAFPAETSGLYTSDEIPEPAVRVEPSTGEILAPEPAQLPPPKGEKRLARERAVAALLREAEALEVHSLAMDVDTATDQELAAVWEAVRPLVKAERERRENPDHGDANPDAVAEEGVAA